jgi:hypothetical protein
MNLDNARRILRDQIVPVLTGFEHPEGGQDWLETYNRGADAILDRILNGDSRFIAAPGRIEIYTPSVVIPLTEANDG